MQHSSLSCKVYNNFMMGTPGLHSHTEKRSRAADSRVRIRKHLQIQTVTKSGSHTHCEWVAITTHNTDQLQIPVKIYFITTEYIVHVEN